MRNEQLLGAHIDIPSACLHRVDIGTTENKAQVVLGGCIAGELLSCLVGILKSFRGISIIGTPNNGTFLWYVSHTIPIPLRILDWEWYGNSMGNLP